MKIYHGDSQGFILGRRPLSSMTELDPHPALSIFDGGVLQMCLVTQTHGLRCLCFISDIVSQSNKPDSDCFGVLFQALLR